MIHVLSLRKPAYKKGRAEVDRVSTGMMRNSATGS